MDEVPKRPGMLRIAAVVILGVISGTILFLIFALGIGGSELPNGHGYSHLHAHSEKYLKHHPADTLDPHMYCCVLLADLEQSL
ncbi:MAG: hypothetical protein WCF90_08370 [Methanomicrobiales archaeon]